MVGDPVKPLSTDEAKERLRVAVREAGLRSWAHDNPWHFIALSLGSGYLAGRLPMLRTSMMWAVARTMLTLSGR